jgi:glycosyltransferase involved in cell wall biosynthesis
VKVLFIVTAYPRHEGDVITPWMGETIERLIASGTQVEVLAPSYRGSATSKIGGVLVHRFRYAPAPFETLTHDVPALDRISGNPLYTATLPSYIAAGRAAAIRIAREGKFDVAHAFWPIPHGIFGKAARNASRAALVSTFFSAELNWKGSARKVFAPIIRDIVTSSDAVTVISSFTGQRLREFAPNVETSTIPFGAAAVNKLDSSFGAKPRKKEDPFELLFVGRLVKRKGVDVLLRAVQQLKDDSRLHVRIVGGGPEKDNLENLAKQLGVANRVTFTGVIDSETIDHFFRECDALVLPAVITETGETEGLGVVLLEAMGYGKPVIASAAGGIVDIVTDRETGLLSPPGDATALAATIRTAMDDPALMTDLAERGTRFADEAFGWDKIVADLQGVYKSAVERRTKTHWRE